MHILGDDAAKRCRTRAPSCRSYAPRMITIKINPEKIRDVIGKGGAVIRALTEETGTTIDIQDDGTVTIASVNADAVQTPRASASRRSPPKSKSAGSTKARCCSLLDFGAIVQRAAGQGRPAAHLADRQGARQRRCPTT